MVLRNRWVESRSVYAEKSWDATCSFSTTRTACIVVSAGNLVYMLERLTRVLLAVDDKLLGNRF